MIFPVTECERVVQVGDKTRLSGAKSFVGKGEDPISKVEICPDYASDSAAQYIDVSGQGERDWYLDWVYPGATRTVVVAIRVTSGALSEVALKTILILSADDDLLFSGDDDLTALEPGLSRYTPDGRSTFLNVHREAKNKILEMLSDRGVRNSDGSALTPAILKDSTEVRTWSRDLTLALIFQGMSNEANDVFQAKAKFYQGLADARADRAYLSLTVPVNGNTDPYRSGQVQTVSLVR